MLSFAYVTMQTECTMSLSGLSWASHLVVTTCGKYWAHQANGKMCLCCMCTPTLSNKAGLLFLRVSVERTVVNGGAIGT